MAVIALVVLVYLLLPGLGHPPESYHRVNCVSNLKQLGIALQIYHDQQKTFPPAYIADSEGKPMHSWRALLLPYFEDPDLAILAKQYRFDEPWNGPNNRKLVAKAPAVFRCPSATDGEGETSYVAVVGDQTAWPGTNGIAWRNIGDGTSKTIAVVETVRSGINWLEPRDIALHQSERGINSADNRPSISSDHSGGANILFADGAVHFLNDDVPPATLRRLLTANGGETVEIPD
ncbi:MAG: DUF1559 domain-containing protein [Pirellulales bacterium]